MLAANCLEAIEILAEHDVDLALLGFKNDSIATPVSLDEIGVRVRAPLNHRSGERREHLPDVHDQRQGFEPASVKE